MSVHVQVEFVFGGVWSGAACGDNQRCGRTSRTSGWRGQIITVLARCAVLPRVNVSINEVHEKGFGVAVKTWTPKFDVGDEGTNLIQMPTDREVSARAVRSVLVTRLQETEPATWTTSKPIGADLLKTTWQEYNANYTARRHCFCNEQWLRFGRTNHGGC